MNEASLHRGRTPEPVRRRLCAATGEIAQAASARDRPPRHPAHQTPRARKFKRDTVRSKRQSFGTSSSSSRCRQPASPPLRSRDGTSVYHVLEHRADRRVIGRHCGHCATPLLPASAGHDLAGQVAGMGQNAGTRLDHRIGAGGPFVRPVVPANACVAPDKQTFRVGCFCNSGTALGREVSVRASTATTAKRRYGRDAPASDARRVARSVTIHSAT